MKVLNLIQGSPEWKAHRATAFNASDAPAMLGVSKYKSRADLIRERATGIITEVDDATQRRFNDGHRFEALARPLAEEIIGEELSPITGADGKYSASFDGITFDGDIIMEHKSANDEIRNALAGTHIANVLSEHYCAQMEHQLMVSGAKRCLFMATTWDKDGNNVESIRAWYEPNFELRARIVAGWEQFEKDVAAYVPVEVKEMPKAEVAIELPALFVHAKGEITEHNMDAFGLALTTKLAETRAIALVTDLDFSNAKAAASKFRETAKAIKLSKEAMLAQTDTIGDAARKMDAWAEDLNKTALQLEKDVEREDKAKKEVIVLGGKNAYTDHIAALEEEIKPIRLNLAAPVFAEAIKNKRSYTSMQDAVDTMLAGAKVAADTAAKDIRAKLAWCKESSAGFGFLFSDLSSLIANNGMEAFQAIVTGRVAKHKADEAEKEEATRLRIQQEEEAKARAKSEAEAAAKLAEETERIRKEEQEKARVEAIAQAKREQLAEKERGAQDGDKKHEIIPPDTLAVSQSTSATESAGKASGGSISSPAGSSNQKRPSRTDMIDAIAEKYAVPLPVARDWLEKEFGGAK